MDDALLNVVVERLGEFPLEERAVDLLLAAFDGDGALARELGSEPDARARDQVPTRAGKATAEPVGAYLRSLTVSGFRGIGPATTIDVPPGPGLTLVVGRNGSGKSSFAEGLEVLLTGTLMRWETAKSAIFRDGWQCKHFADGTEIKADFLIEGKGKAATARTWAPGAEVRNSQEWLQADGDKRQPGLDGLGWTSDLTTYRPFLSHAELEAFFGTPHELYDLLASVLGLEDLTAAATRLNTARKQRDDQLADAKQRLASILMRLEALDDERATACLAALSGKTWDIPAAKEAATGAGSPGRQLSGLRKLERLTPPAGSEVSVAVADLLTAAEGLDHTAGTSAEQARQLAQLLETAMKHHEAHGDGDCPVCGRPGALTAQWHDDTGQHLKRLREDAQVAEEAVTSAGTAAAHALTLIQQQPPVPDDDIDGIDVTSAWAAWQAWSKRPADADLKSPAGLRALAEHLVTTSADLGKAIAALTAAVTAELSRRDDQWTPLAANVASWCDDAEPAVRGSSTIKALKAARKWLVDATDDLRNARLEPLARQSRDIWADLRQESNVDLGAFRLLGSSTRRSVELSVAIDGTPGNALGVMSQGEINALALSIFLPRATMRESPFRFLVIDDPVQAMDPAKVDGLAKVLARVAADRQVIVFTHDNRLASAVRDLTIPVTILEVTRRIQSAVDVRPCLDPVRQALKDASDLSKDHEVPSEVARRVIPGQCRTALEAAFIQAFWRRELQAKKTRAEIDEALADVKGKLYPVAALGLTGNPAATGQVLAVLNRWGSGFADTFLALNKSAHGQFNGEVGGLLRDATALIDKVEEKLW
jgi:recombinational DNA repair ATPase RecF